MSRYQPEIVFQLKVAASFIACLAAVLAAGILHWAAESFPRPQRRKGKD